jgi:hypothetical protein
MFYLYEIRFPNGKKYIGVTNNPTVRRRQHFYDAKGGRRDRFMLPVYCAIRKFTSECSGDAIKFVVIGQSEIEEFILAAEIREIRDQNTLVPNGYNVAVGGTRGPMGNPEVRAKVSATRLTMGCTPAMREAGIKRRGVKRTAEHQANLSAALRGKKWSDKRRANPARYIGHPCSAEDRAKISMAKKGIMRTAKQKATIAEGCKKARIRANNLYEMAMEYLLREPGTITYCP